MIVDRRILTAVVVLFLFGAGYFMGSYTTPTTVDIESNQRVIDSLSVEIDKLHYSIDSYQHDIDSMHLESIRVDSLLYNINAEYNEKATAVDSMSHDELVSFLAKRYN